jgi:small subunit ribosomal protein S6
MANLNRFIPVDTVVFHRYNGQVMKEYEIMTIVKAALGDDKAKGVSKDVQDLITAQKGEIVKDDFWGKRKFSYEIKGDKEGYYDVIIFKLEPEALTKVKSKLKLMENVVRYLVTAKA